MRWLLVVGMGCGDPGAGGDAGGGSEDGGCAGSAECGDGSVCLAYGDGDGACAPVCSGSADACGAEAQCGGVGLLSVDVCQEPADPEAPPSEPPRVVCVLDVDCDAFGSGLVCAEWLGVRSCTIPCAREQDCTPPAVGGFVWDVLTCAEDEGDPSRDVCVLDPACLDDPTGCLSY